MSNVIIVIDDSPSVLEYMKGTLELVGYKVITFSHPLDAINEIPKLETPELIICDYIMFDEEGLSVIEDLRAAGVNTKYMLFTSFHCDSLSKVCKENDIIFMVKELNKTKVLEVLQCL